MGDDAGLQFSARWQTRVEVTGELSDVIFNSLASGGSRVLFDEVTVLDAWQKFGSAFSSDPVAVGAGYHYIAYECRSAESPEDTPTNSYAKLSWRRFNVTDLSAGAESSLFADIGWLAVSSGTGSIDDGVMLEAGYVSATGSNLMVDVSFAGSFDITPHLYAGYQAISSAEGGHGRLVEASQTGAAIALEYDSCDAIVVSGGARAVGWIALTNVESNIEDTGVH
eukprot:SAG22_NODE_408_length_10942_cov_6.157429_7_plen_224_part_00